MNTKYNLNAWIVIFILTLIGMIVLWKKSETARIEAEAKAAASKNATPAPNLFQLPSDVSSEMNKLSKERAKLEE